MSLAMPVDAFQLTKIVFPEGAFENLVTLNISSNELTAFPDGIVRCTKLEKLYASYNKLKFEGGKCKPLLEYTIASGLPAGIGKLVQLHVLHLSHNQVELIPEGISRCVKLQRLKIDNNRLITLPDGIHLLPDLKELDLHKYTCIRMKHTLIVRFSNDDLVMPPKPSDKQKAMAFYNIDFSLQNQVSSSFSHMLRQAYLQLRLAGQSPASSASSMQSSNPHKDPIQRKKDFIRRRRHQADQDGASKVIQVCNKKVFHRTCNIEHL